MAHLWLASTGASPKPLGTAHDGAMVNDVLTEGLLSTASQALPFLCAQAAKPWFCRWKPLPRHWALSVGNWGSGRRAQCPGMGRENLPWCTPSGLAMGSLETPRPGRLT